MKKQIFMYLFVFALLYIVFQYMNAKKAFAKMNDLEKQVHVLEKENEALEKSSTASTDYYFSLKGSDAARDVFRKRGLQIDTVAAKVKNTLRDYNKPTADNPLIPFSGMEGKMRVNHIEILNYKWVIADFTDGVYWGEMVLKYELTEEGKVNFEVIEAFLYPTRR